MLEITAKKIAEYLVKCGEISNNDYEVEYYRYGIEVALSSLLNLAIIIIIGIISMHIIESLIFLIVFIFVRQVTGGYHADTYFKCNLYLCLSFVLLLISYDFFSNNNNVYLVTAINIVSLLIISIFSPVENKNKPIAKANRKGLKIKSIVFSIIISIISIILHCKSIKYGSILSLILLLISMLIIVAKLKERRERIYEQTKK
ncbi:accessory gene regulator ArgB-like protein [Ruminococcus sp.]|uniref:accessory gene regulator ArgB-like protein n=1 Tax=Ruminococcus sp. TaxID=41978 RepID=UPI0025DD6C61|nr:accessory gene regulator B family protein [Ruminococcus sp.]